jgi:acetyl esterase/lipase
MALKRTLAAAAAFAASACSPLTAFNTLTPKDPAKLLAQDVAYGQHPRQRLDVYAPRRPVADAPVLVFFYGGGWDSGRRQDYVFAARALASRGFITVVPDYRLYPEVRYPVFLEDGAQAVRWAQDHAERYGGDADALLLAGHSAGAYIAVQLALDRSYLAGAGVGSERIKGAAGLAGPYDFLPLDSPATINAFGQADDLRDSQPINHARPDAPPLFLAHGDQDRVVGVYHTERLASRLERIGAPVEMRLYPGMDHAGAVLALSQPFRRRGAVLAEMTDFLKDAARR